MKKNNIFIIAEAGINHNGNIGLAMKMVDLAKDAGADAIKFQTFFSEKVITKYAPKAEYQLVTTDENESQLDMARKLELSFDEFTKLSRYSREAGIKFLSTPFDDVSLDFLVNGGMDIIKIPSGETTNIPYLQLIGSYDCDVIMSTGMMDLDEVRVSLDVLISSGVPKNRITILHCNTEYPTPMSDVNLRAMLTMKRELGVRVGYSDHSLGIEVPIAAATLGASVIEKHFTLDNSFEGPDHRASLDPSDLVRMITSIRNIELALGDGIKRPSLSEVKNIKVARRSLVAAIDINAGEFFTYENVTAKRPGTGLSPMLLDSIIGTQSKNNIKQDDFITI